MFFSIDYFFNFLYFSISNSYLFIYIICWVFIYFYLSYIYICTYLYVCVIFLFILGAMWCVGNARGTQSQSCRSKSWFAHIQQIWLQVELNEDYFICSISASENYFICSVSINENYISCSVSLSENYFICSVSVNENYFIYRISVNENYFFCSFRFLFNVSCTIVNDYFLEKRLFAMSFAQTLSVEYIEHNSLSAT